jgi:hypothetical protein
MSNRLLQENQRVEVCAKDPFFEDAALTDLNMPYISPFVQSKLAFKAIYLDDIGMLKRLIESYDKVPSVHISKSVYNKWVPAEYALFLENKQALDILIDDFCDSSSAKTKRIEMPEIMLDKFRNGMRVLIIYYYMI